MEEWRPVVSHVGLYEVSNHGGVRSLDRWVRHSRNPNKLRLWRGKELRPKPINKNGHLEVHLCRDGVVSRHLVHHLVLEAFVGPRQEQLGLHWDDDPTNNHVSNLRWGTPPDNGQDAMRNGRVRPRPDYCPQGHEYTETNTYIAKSGSPVCRQCRNDKGRALYHAQKGELHMRPL